MANLFQAWDEDIQALGAAKASDQQIEARRQQLAEHFKAKAKAAGLSSKKIYETLDQFDAYSRQNSTNEDNRLSPEEEEMAQRVKDGTERTGAMLEVGKRFKDIGLGALSSLTRMGGDIAQTWSDVGDNDKTELSAQAAQGLYNITDDIRSNYSEGTKRAKKDFWSPEGLTMGLAENVGQIAGTAALLGTGGALAGAAGITSKAGKLATMAGMAAPLAYSQGYGQGKENSLDEINKTSNAQLWENVKAEAKAYDDAGGTGEVPYLVSMFKEAGGDINLMKDLMAENAGNRAGLMTVATEPLAMGVGSLMSRGAAAGGTGVMAKFANAMNNQGMSNELARRVAAGGKLAIASQAGKIAATQMGREGVQETAQEGLEGYYAKGEGSRAAGRKGELTSEDWSSSDGNGIIQQGLQGGAIGLLMGGGGAMATLRHSSKLALEKNGLPEKHDAAIIAKEQADINLAKATEILDLNPEDIKAQEAHAEATDAALVANNNLEQLTGKFNALYTPEEQAVIKAKTMEGVAARAKVAEDAAKAQKELDDAQAKAAQEQQAQQAEILKAQRENTVNKLASMVGDEVALNEELARLNLGAEEENSLVTEAHKVAKKQKKAEKQAQSQAQAKTPLDSALDMLFDNKGNRNTKDAQDAADAHKVQLVDLVPAIAQRIESNKQQQTQAERQNKKAEYEKTKVREAEQAANKEKLTDKQQLENTLADFARNNDHDSMVNFLRDYDPKEADTLIANAYKAVDKETKAAQDAITASQKAEAAKAKKAEDDKQSEQKKTAFTKALADLHATNPDATMADLNAIGKKHSVKSPIELAKAWVQVKREASGAKKPKETLALPAPKTVMVADAQGNVIPTTENNVPKKPRSNDFSVPSGLKVDISNAKNTRSDLGKGSYIGSAMIVRQDGQPFPTEQVAQQALENKSKKPRKKKEKPITKDTHEVVPVDGGYAIAPKSEQQITQDNIIGEYARDTSPNDIIKLVKTETGYELGFEGFDEISQYFDGEDALKNAKSFLREYGFKKIKPKIEIEQQAIPKESVVEQSVEDITGEYTHSQFHDATATVSKTEKGYNINWGDEVQSFTGKNAAEKTKSILEKEGFIKGKPKDEGDGGVTVEPTPNKPVSPNNTTQATPTTTGEQIAEAMDKTAQAITEAAHNKVVERVKNGEEIVYKQPAAIERVKQDERYQVELNDKGHAVVKNIKDLNGEWVKKNEPKQAKNYSDKDIERTIKKWEELSQSMRSGILTRLDEGWYVEKKKTGVASRYEFTNGEQYLANSKKNDSSKMYDFIYFAMDTFGDLKTALEVSGVLSRFPQKEAADLTTKLKELLKQGKISKEDYSWSTLVINDAVARDGKPSTVKTVETIKKQFISPLSAPKDEPIAAEATHIENGKIEEVTNEIIRESLAKVDDKPVNGRTMSLKEAKQWLLDSIDVAIAVAPKTLSKAGKDAIELVNDLEGKIRTKSITRSEEDKKGIQDARNLLKDLYITFDVPNDGKFKVLNTIESLQRFKANIEKTKGFTENQKPVKPFSAPSENSPEITIMGFLNDGELENAYFFAENQDKPIKFTLSRRGEPIAFFLTEPVDLGNNITGFVGISTYPMSKSKRWLVIEEKSRTSIGFEEISKRAAIKSAKARLSSLRKEDLESFASKMISINKTDEEMKADWLAKNNIKIDEQSNEQNSINRKTENLAPAEKAQQVKKEPQKAEQPKQDKPIKKSPLKATASKSEFNKAFGVNESKIDEIAKDFERESQNESVQNNEPVPTKQPETKTELKAKIDFSEASVKLEDALNKWEAIKKGDIVVTKSGRALIAQSDAKGKMSIRFKVREGGLEEALSVLNVTGNNKLGDMLTKRLQEQSKNELVKKLIGKTPEGKDLYEDGRGVRFTDNGRGVQLGEDVAITMQNGKTVYDVSGRTDEHRTVEEVAARQPKQPTKKESLLIKIDDELDAALDDLANVFKEQGNRLSSGVDPVIMGKVLAIGMKASTLYLAKGAVKFAVWAENIIAALSSKGVPQDAVQPYLKGLYAASKMQVSPEIRQQMDKEDDVYDFDFAILNESTSQDTQNVTTPSQTNGTNARERDKTPESSQVQRASKSEPAQANTEKRDDGVSANSGGRSDGRNNSNESGESETRSQQPNVASTRSKSSKLGDSTRSIEPSDGANLRNYRIQPNELKRTGSWKATAEQNVQIVELVKTIIAENRAATPEEKALLTKFTGWGASEIANGIFPNQYGSYKDASWKALGERLEAALTPEEYAQAKRTTQYAHYTSEPIIRSVYAALSRFGFNGGSLVEPGMGVGLFNGLMPDAMANNSQYTGIEYDTITGNIAKLLYPDSNIIVGDFTQTKLPKNFFDVAIGNPPFGSIKIQSDPEYKKQGFLLHDYFFAKTIDRVKEGGLLVFVTSKGTMDKTNDRARKYLSDRADLVGAIRLPQTAFKDNAGTEVVTDVIFLRKRMAGQEPAGEAWAGLKEITTPQGATSINEYFATHPEMILGKSALTGSMYRANEYTVEPIAGSDIETLFSEAINNLPENIYTPQQGSKAEQAAVQRRDYDPKIKKEGGIYVADDGVLMQVNNGQGTPLTQKQNSKHELVDLSPKEKEWLKDYVGVRDALKQAQYDQLQDNANWQQSLDALNKTYDAFVKKHGFMLEHSVSERENEDGSVTVTKRFKNKSIMGLDAESALINALEQINSDNSISKAPALLGRVINKPSTPVITSTQDAMFVVFNELGRFDLAKVAKLINKSEKEVIAELGDSIYEDPSQSWTTADDYLSGNVVRKLKEAEQAARLNPKYQRNVTALKAVQPPALAPQDINVQLGAAWIPASDVTQFASEILSERFRVNYSPLTGQWSVEGTANYSSEWGIPAKDSKDILEAVLNNRQIKVTYTDANKKTHTDTEKTEKANDIAKKMRQSFKKWLWEDVPRTERLVTYYNEHFNNIAPRSFDGQHLTLPGVSSRFDLRPHQKRAIWRTIQQGDVYYAHAVGAGKTFTMIASGMEERRLGLVKKPMYVVPNHMLAQFSKEFLELYPMANIMVADEANFHTHNRRKFVAQAALNNPDAIVITHSAFGRIGMSSDYSSKFIKNQIYDWQIALQEVGSDERITRKQIERRIEQLENKLKALLDGEKDQLLNFEELGVDRLYVDEGHEFRKLDFPTNRGNIKGIDPSGSQKSMDLYMKVEYLRGKNPSRALVMASGTPVTNTMGELFTVQRFFNPSQLEEDGDSRFDAWSAHYGEVVDGLEQNAAGGYETVSRFAKFVNVPELMSRVRYFMDILTSNQLGDLVQRPDVVGGGRQVIVTPAPDGYKDYQKDLERRIKAIRNRKAPPKPGDDIILSVIGDGRFSAIDMRFVDSTLPSDPNSKLNRMLDDLISAYHETANNEYMTSGAVDENKGSSLMLFTDIGLGEQSAKNRGFDMKAWIEKRLIDGGVKREHIAFMRDNKAHSKKEKLFDDMRQGKKRILIGGKDMETGVNAQKRLTHLFHLDAPWFPASVEQREGRIIRQGNQNKIVAIRAYASKGSYDSTMWGMNSRKARFIEQAMSGDSSIRNMEDVSEASAFEMAAALASGDERYLKLAGLKGDVERLSRLYSAHIDEQKRFAREKAYLESQNKHSTSKIEQINAAIAQRKPIKAGEFLASVGKRSFDNREDFSKALFEKFKEVVESYKADEVELGSIAGFPIVYNGVELRGGNFAADLRVDLPIDAEPLAIFPIDPAYSVSGIATRAVNQTNALDKELVSRKSSIEQNTKDLARIGRRIGASFPEMAELNEKQQALNELEQELNAESKADDGLEQSNPQDTDSKPKFSQSSTIGDRTITQVRDKLISRFGKRIIDLLESKGILKIHQSMSDKDIPAEAVKQSEGVTEGFYLNGTIHLIADNLTDETIIPTFVHELGGHKGFQEMMSPKAYELIMQQFDRLVAQGNAIAIKAKQRAEKAEKDTARQQDEYIPYLLTEQVTAQEATPQERNAVKRLIDHILRAVKGWVVRHLSKYDTTYKMSRRVSESLTPADILYMAERMVGDIAKRGGDNNNRPKFSKTEQSQFDRLLAKADKMIAEQGKLLAPNGKPSKLNRYQWAQVRTDNFKNWFGDWENDPENSSKVVDENGEPMVVYHGTNAEFNEFEPTQPNFYQETEGWYFFTDKKESAATFGKNVMPVFLNIDNPTLETQGTFKTWNLYDDEGNYGFIAPNTDTGNGGISNQYVVENPNQIKSATDNNGEFSPTNPDIRFSRKAKNPIAEGIKSAANDAKNSLPKPISGKIDHFLAGRRLPSNDVANIVSKTELSLYHRTISTQQNTALQLPDFKKVYDMAQRYLQHVSVDAYAALQAAPNLLGQLETWSDLKKEFKKAWYSTYVKQKTDRAAVAEVIFDETLNNELRSEEDILKSLSRDQRKIYKEARDAIEVSLKNTAKSEMVRKLLAAEAINWTTVEDLMDKNLPVEQFAQSVRDLVESRIGGLSNELEAILDSDKMVKKAFKTGEKEGLSKEQKIELKKALAVKAQIDTTKEALKSLNDVEKRLDTLLEQGYAPLMRFGEYTLTVRGQDDKVQSFFMFETKAEQARAANAIVVRYGKTVKLETDMISKEEFKQFAGMTPETMALFAKETGMDKDEAYQHYLKLAIPARSAMTRMIKRKGTAGFSDDIQRVVASFVMSNARMSAKNIYAAQIEKSIQAIESGKSVKDQALVMKENVFNPKENFAQLRNILFLWNLGGSLFFGLLNMTQPYLQTLPHLSQYVSIADAGRAILRGSKIAGVAMKNGHAPRGYEEEYNRAVREGHVDPQNVFMLSGVERGKTGLSNSWTSVASHLMGSIAQVTESFNRKAVFIASIDVANKKGAAWLKKHGFDSAYDFAVDSIAQTQGVYNKANRSNWANTSVGAPLMTFKQYSINYAEQMVRMWRKKAESGDEGKKAVFLMLAMLASLSGVMGLPFIKDILDVSETTAAFLGNPVNIEREARLVLGKDLADPIFNGVLNHYVFSVLGVDTQSRTSMGDLLPLSNALNPTLSAQGRVNEFASIAGATGGLIEKGYDATQFIARGDLGMAGLTLLPRSVTSLITGSKMAATDEVTDSKGNKLFDTTWSEGLVKAIDATPKRMADLSRTKSLEWKDKSIQAYMTTNFKQKIIAAMMDNDQAEVQNLMKKVQEWNTSRPKYPVFINLNTLSKNANKKDQTFDARESIPKGMDWMKNERPEM